MARRDQARRDQGSEPHRLRWPGAAAILQLPQLVRLLRIDARRPAAWVSLGAAAVVGWLLAGFGEVHERLLVPVAIATGGLLAVASLGEPSLGMPDGRRRPWGVDWLVRSVWPVGGVLLSLVLTTAGSWLAVGLFVATTAATVGVLLAAVVAGVAPAAAASVTLALAGAGAFAAVAVAIVADASPLWQIANATLAWCTLAAAGWVSVRDERHALPWSWPAAARRPSLPAAATPPVLAASAVVTSLAAMVVCYFLAPHLRWLYAVIAGGWFVCLAVPTATCGGGGWIGRRLVTAAAGSPLLPGSTRRAALLSLPILVTLGWPAVVAAALPAADGSWSPGPLLAVGLLAAGACLLVAAVATAGRVSGECARATVLAAVAVAAAVASAGLPNLPSLAAAAGQAMTAGSDRSGRSVLSAGSDPARLPRRPSRLESQPEIPDSDWMSRSPGPRPDTKVGQSYGS